MNQSFLLLQDGNKLILEGRLTWFLLLQESIYVADQVEIQIPKPLVDESTSFTATAYYRNRATKSAATPTTVHYRIECLSTKKTLIDWTAITPVDTNNDIAVTSTANAIQDATHRIEIREIVVQADRGLSTQVTGVGRWKVRNRLGIT